MAKTRVETAADVIVKAMEMSDDMEHVLIIYQRRSDSPSPKGGYLGFIESSQMKLETANFLADSYKHWLWSAMQSDDDEK